MKKLLPIRLVALWRLLTCRTWALYTPDGDLYYRMGWQHMSVGDCQALRQWASDREAEAVGQAQALDTLLNLNPGIRPADA